MAAAAVVVVIVVGSGGGGGGGGVVVVVLVIVIVIVVVVVVVVAVVVAAAWLSFACATSPISVGAQSLPQALLVMPVRRSSAVAGPETTTNNYNDNDKM